MKNPFPLRLLCLCFLVFPHLLSHAQSRFGLECGGDLVLPTSKQLNKVFYTGFDMYFGFKVAVVPDKFWVVPDVGYKGYMKNTTSDGVRETFETVKAGLQFQYKMAEHRKWAFYPVVRIDYNWSSNYFSKDLGYDPNTNISTIGVTDNYLSGHDLSYDAGIKIMRSNLWYIKVDYEYYNPSLKVNSDVNSQLEAEGYTMPAKSKLNCSSVNIGLGINFDFKRSRH